MAADHPSPGESTEPTASDDHSGSGTQPRSYDCTFCKRGFSNAQALGGHMNIHRKDRAKLKQPSSSQNQLSADISNDIFPSHPPPSHRYMPRPMPGDDDRRFISRWPWMPPSEHHNPGERTHDDSPQQRPFFVERPTRGYDWPLASHGDGEEEMQRSAGLGTKTTGLDLELRLGPEPTDPSTADQE